VQLKNSHLFLLMIMGAVLVGSAFATENHGCTRAYRQATFLLNQGKFEQAVKSYDRIVEMCPKFYPVYMMLGVAYQDLGNFKKAEAYLHRAVDLAPESADPHLNLGLYHLSRGDTLTASEEFKKAIAIDPKRPAGWFDLGLEELKAGNPARALENLEKANQLDPGNQKIRFALISAALNASQPDLVQRQVDQLIARDPDNPELLLALGALLEEGGDTSKASQLFEKAKEASSDPLTIFLDAANQATARGNYRSGLAILKSVSDAGRNSASWNELIGDVYYKLGQVKPAVDHLQEAIRLAPLNEDYYLELGSLLTQYNANDACLVIFQSAAKILPHSIKIRSALAVAYMMEKKYSKAEAILQDVIVTSPDYLSAYQLLGESYGAAHKWGNLKRVGQTIVNHDPHEAVGWYYQAEADFQLAMTGDGKLTIAETEVRKSLKFRSQYGPAYYLLGKILAAENRGKEAVVALKKAASLDDDPTVFYTLALTFRKLGQASESKVAMRDFNEAVARKKAAYRKLSVKIDASSLQDANE
jgi:tetratricopeptide (TPR) repeat protein